MTIPTKNTIFSHDLIVLQDVIQAPGNDPQSQFGDQIATLVSEQVLLNNDLATS